MGPYSGNCEIVEVKEELSSVQHSEGIHQINSSLRMDDKVQKHVPKLGDNGSLDEDLNKLFSVIKLKTSFDGLSPTNHAGPSRKNAQKKPMRTDSSHSLGIGVSEPATLKQALRGLCISQASEMAAMKRLSKQPRISGVSVSGKIRNMSKSVLVEPTSAGLSLNGTKKNVVEISMVPEESASNYSERIPQHLQVPMKKLVTTSAPSSPVTTTKLRNLIKLPQEAVHASIDMGPTLKSILGEKEKIRSARSPSVLKANDAILEKGNNVSGSAKLPNKASASNPVVGHASMDMDQMLKSILTEKETIRSANSASVKSIGSMLEMGNNVPGSLKLPNKASASKPVRKSRLQATSSSSCSSNGNKVRKATRNTHGLDTTVLRNKNFVNKKSNTIPSTSDEDGTSDSLNPGSSQMICQRCQCTLKNEMVEFDKKSPASNCSSSAFGPVAVKSNVNKAGFTSSSCSSSSNRSVFAKPDKNAKQREKGELSQSSKSSLGEYSSTTSMSEESNRSRPSCSNRPHMSKNERWKAIQLVRLKHRILGLDHFNLIKKLGCGDIGTVYLAELIGSNSLFAIKVMDNAYLVRRKKMPRAETERDILRNLDHPFLPTLYAHFTSDNLSCLVMDYCPGGDLHVLRQKQPGRNFPEQAARFYAAEVLLALEYLHMLGVVYRDLKPENILVREDGHIMLTDFDLSLRCTVSPTLLKSSSSLEPAKIILGPCTGSSCIDPFCIEPSCKVPCFSPRFQPTAASARKPKSDNAAQVRSLPQLVVEPTSARSNSFVGTHEYLAPEIIKGEGHGSAVDWWTFGIFLYELLYGRTPFKGSGNEETLANVVLESLKFPGNPLVSFQARDLIKGLLLKDPESRLGSERGAAEIKQHPFFEGLNWALIRCTVPPEIPEPCDLSAPHTTSQQGGTYLEYSATGDPLEFELF